MLHGCYTLCTGSALSCVYWQLCVRTTLYCDRTTVASHSSDHPTCFMCRGYAILERPGEVRTSSRGILFHIRYQTKGQQLKKELATRSSYLICFGSTSAFCCWTLLKSIRGGTSNAGITSVVVGINQARCWVWAGLGQLRCCQRQHELRGEQDREVA